MPREPGFFKVDYLCFLHRCHTLECIYWQSDQFGCLGIGSGFGGLARGKIHNYFGFAGLQGKGVGPIGERIEIQIRTWEMDGIARSGIAAHWSYKEGKRIDENISKKFSWIQNLVDNQ
ncbi:MAG: hypothetical protein KJ985_04855, partial [Proteobacteria bacterium]|nr:hypothetical protein [Pseudomonadota bacterium]